MKKVGGRLYGSIPHLPGSKLGEHDHFIHKGQAGILTGQSRGRNIVVQEKLDGSCVGVIRHEGLLTPALRSGWSAISSPYRQHHHFHNWAMVNSHLFANLDEGQSVVGEWLAQTHGTHYALRGPAFYAFDCQTPIDAHPYRARLALHVLVEQFPGLERPITIYEGPDPPGVEEAWKLLLAHPQRLSSLEGPEGLMYRAETAGRVEFMAKWVRSDFEPGKYMFGENSGKEFFNSGFIS